MVVSPNHFVLKPLFLFIFLQLLLLIFLLIWQSGGFSHLDLLLQHLPAGLLGLHSCMAELSCKPPYLNLSSVPYARQHLQHPLKLNYALSVASQQPSQQGTELRVRPAGPHFAPKSHDFNIKLQALQVVNYALPVANHPMLALLGHWAQCQTSTAGPCPTPKSHDSNAEKPNQELLERESRTRRKLSS